MIPRAKLFLMLLLKIRTTNIMCDQLEAIQELLSSPLIQTRMRQFTVWWPFNVQLRLKFYAKID